MSRRPLIGLSALFCVLTLTCLPALAESAMSIGEGQCPDKVATTAEAAKPAEQSAKPDAVAAATHPAGDAGKLGKARPRWQSFLPGMIR